MTNFVSEFYKNIQKVCQHLKKEGIACSVEAYHDNSPFVVFNLFILEEEELLRIEFPVDNLDSYSDEQVVEYLKDRYSHNYKFVEGKNLSTNTIQ
jgi:hypothetical protein